MHSGSLHSTCPAGIVIDGSHFQGATIQKRGPAAAGWTEEVRYSIAALLSPSHSRNTRTFHRKTQTPFPPSLFHFPTAPSFDAIQITFWKLYLQCQALDTTQHMTHKQTELWTWHELLTVRGEEILLKLWEFGNYVFSLRRFPSLNISKVCFSFRQFSKFCTMKCNVLSIFNFGKKYQNINLILRAAVISFTSRWQPCFISQTLHTQSLGTGRRHGPRQPRPRWYLPNLIVSDKLCGDVWSCVCGTPAPAPAPLPLSTLIRNLPAGDETRAQAQNSHPHSEKRDGEHF